MPTLQEKKKRQEYITKANQTEEKYGLPKNILVGLIGAESNFNPYAVNKHSNASGIAQFMKGTAQEYGINPFNPSESIDAAGKYLASSYKKFGNIEDALMSYNMGVGGLQKVKAGKKQLPKETAEYVGRVYKNAGIHYEEPSYANSVAPYMNQQSTPTINYLQIQQNTPTFASAPTPEKEEDKEEETDPEVQKVEQESNFLKEIEKEDYAHLQPQQRQQQQETPQTDYMQQYEQIGQFLGEGNQVAQQGGKKLDTGHYRTTTGKVVVWGTPEYEKAYNRGEVVTDKGVKSPVTLDGGQLDEVVVKNNYKRRFWEKYKDKIVEENKDAGVLGAVIGVPLSAVASLPQLAMMEGLTGKMQRPSEAMGIQNPYGAMAVDAVTDPANLIGAGVLTKENALSKLVKIQTSIAPELRQGLHSNGFLDIFKKTKPTNMSGQDWLHKWNNDPITLNKIAEREKISESFSHPRFEEAFPEYPLIREGHLADKELDAVKTKFINNISNERDFPIRTDIKKTPVLNYEDLKINEPQIYKEFVNTSGGISPGRGSVYIDGQKYKNHPLKTKESAIVHELTHHAENNGDSLTINEQKELLSPFNKDNFQLDRPARTGKIDESYYTEPTEIHARMNQTRFELGLSPKDIFTEKMFNTVTKENNWNGMGGYIKDKKGFVNLMNNFWAVTPVAGASYLAAQENKQQGGQQKYTDNEIAFLSEIAIKDNNGYWNPNNQGKVVEIDSPNITMKGVNQKLIGISKQTGEKKIMKPNKEYYFKNTQNVLEIPFFKK